LDGEEAGDITQDMENNPHLRGAPRAERVEFHHEVLAGIGDMNMYEEDADSDTEEVNGSQGLEEIVTSLMFLEVRQEGGE
jgi:hypothetical protein